MLLSRERSIRIQTMARKKRGKPPPLNGSGGKGTANDNTSNISKKEEKFETRLTTILLAKSLVFSPEEATCLAASLVTEIKESDLSREQACVVAFEDYFSLSRQDAKATQAALFNLEGDSDRSSESDDKSSEEEPSQRPNEEMDSDSDDGEYIGEGECELCERIIKLTKHHLIPRSTWPRILARLSNASQALAKQDVHRAGLILGPGLAHMLEPLTIADGDKVAIKGLLRRTCNICRSCHSTIHRSYGNMTLATDFSTTELLLQDEKIYKYCKWASKQKV